MAKIVTAFGTPHTPFLPEQVSNAPGQLKPEAMMNEVREHLEKAKPDVIIVFTSDHFVNFFYNHFPAFCVGVIDEAETTPETGCNMPHYSLQRHKKMAAALHRAALKSNFDLATAQEVKLEHTIMVPLHFITPDMNIPIIPIYNGGLAPPAPSARRCYSLGRMIRRFVNDWEGNERVALMASGSVSLEVGGPRNTTWFDEPWVETVKGLMSKGDYQGVARRATEQKMLAAGNVAHELLNWTTVFGALDGALPDYLDSQRGSVFAAWDLEDGR